MRNRVIHHHDRLADVMPGYTAIQPLREIVIGMKFETMERCSRGRKISGGDRKTTTAGCQESFLCEQGYDGCS